MMDEFIHWPTPYLLLPTTSDKLMSCMMEIRMKKHLVQQFHHCGSTILPQKIKNNVGLTFSVGDTIPRFIISIKQDN